MTTSAEFQGGAPPGEEDYANPLEQSSRWALGARALAIRSGASMAFGIGNMSKPPAPEPNKTIYLDSTFGHYKGKKQIRVDIYKSQQEKKDRKIEKSTQENKKRPAIIVFHGGGFVLGNATDDARWAAAANGALDAVVFAVSYRLAPGYPFPTPVEDCADSILQIASRADEFGIDKDRIIVSGFSAGGTLSLASWVLLQDPGRWGYELTLPVPNIAGLALFYPLLDWTIDRPKKRETCARPEFTLSSGLTDLFDASYIYPPLPREKRDDPRLSPGLMSDEMIDRLPPVHLCLCEYDMLLAEGQTFAKRMTTRGKEVSVRVVDQEKHAWDKPPPFGPKPSVAVEYRAALETMQTWLGITGEPLEATSSTVSTSRNTRKMVRHLSRSVLRRTVTNPIKRSTTM